MDLNNIIIKQLISEKSSALAANKQPQFSFLVSKKAVKGEIAAALKYLAGVDVIAVNTQVLAGKKKRVLTKTGRYYRSLATKKAIVTLKTGQKIENGSEVKKE